LFGVSAGGFFAAWTIFQERSPFRAYLISSPAMAYGDGDIFRQEARYAASHADLPVSIYLASGSLEIDDPFIEGVGQIVSGQARLGALLRGRRYPGLVLHSEIHQGLGHSDAAAMTMARGLRLLYPRSTAPR
jgi:predicted alpha/beta superfamily hydrolase